MSLFIAYGYEKYKHKRACDAHDAAIGTNINVLVL